MITKIILFITVVMFSWSGNSHAHIDGPTRCYIDYSWTSECEREWGIKDPDLSTPESPFLPPRRPSLEGNEEEFDHYKKTLSLVWSALKTLQPDVYAYQMELFIWNSRHLLAFFNSLETQDDVDRLVDSYMSNSKTQWVDQIKKSCNEEGYF